MAALLSLRSVIAEAEGSAMRTQIVLSAAGIGQTSVLARMGLPLTSITWRQGTRAVTSFSEARGSTCPAGYADLSRSEL